jgi:hypothetical protein
MGIVKEVMELRSVPMLKMLIKDHEKADRKGEYPMRLVVPATNFVAAAIPSTAGYLGIRSILNENHGINFSGFTVIQHQSCFAWRGRICRPAAGTTKPREAAGAGSKRCKSSESTPSSLKCVK